jgi:hypothetical protein
VSTSPGSQPDMPSDSEQRVLDAIAVRGVADFTGEPDASRRLRGAFIEALISGSEPGIPRLCCPLRLRGAQLVGPIRALPTVRDGVAMTLLFRDCDFDSPVDFSGADLLSLRLVNCTLPALVGISLTTRADLDLSGSQFTGVTDYLSDLGEVGDCAVHLNHAHIGGRLLLAASPQARFQAAGSIRLDGARVDAGVSLHGALLQVDGQSAFSARSATVGGNVELLPGAGHRCEVYGEVALVAAQIAGDLDCASARLCNPGGRTLHCEDLVVESVFLTRELPDIPFESHGRLNFLTATVGGGFFMTNARLAPGPDYSGLLGHGGPVAFNAQQIRISNSLVLHNVGAAEADGVFRVDDISPVEGWFLLAGAQMNALVDNVDTGWPAPGYLDFDGASYQRIRHLDGGELVGKRIAWLRRQFSAGRPGAASYRPQPYEQLTRVLRSSGLSREADAIAVEKIRMRLAARVDRPWLRLFPQLLMLVSHHGYSTSRALLSFLLFVLLGGIMYTAAIAAFDQAFFPFEQPPEPTTYVLPFGLGEQAVPLGCPGLDTLHYALDFALPVIHLGQDDFCRFVPNGPARWLWLTLHSVFGLCGAALSAVVVLTLTGLLRRD